MEAVSAYEKMLVVLNGILIVLIGALITVNTFLAYNISIKFGVFVMIVESAVLRMVLRILSKKE
jgi:hypothetical protein